MTTTLFLELDTTKKNRILEAAISEFAAYGYYNSSTNRIVKSSGISKGSLFKYFPTKEDLYFYILDSITLELSTDFKKTERSLPSSFFERILAYSEREILWYMEHPEKYRIILDAFTEKETEISQKIQARYSTASHNIYYGLMENIDTLALNGDKQKIITILKWFLKGFNDEFIRRIPPNTNISILKEEYIKELTEYISILKLGLIQKEEGRTQC